MEELNDRVSIGFYRNFCIVIAMTSFIFIIGVIYIIKVVQFPNLLWFLIIPSFLFPFISSVMTLFRGIFFRKKSLLVFIWVYNLLFFHSVIIIADVQIIDTIEFFFITAIVSFSLAASGVFSALFLICCIGKIKKLDLSKTKSNGLFFKINDKISIGDFISILTKTSGYSSIKRTNKNIYILEMSNTVKHVFIHLFNNNIAIVPFSEDVNHFDFENIKEISGIKTICELLFRFNNISPEDFDDNNEWIKDLNHKIDAYMDSKKFPKFFLLVPISIIFAIVYISFQGVFLTLFYEQITEYIGGIVMGVAIAVITIYLQKRFRAK